MAKKMSHSQEYYDLLATKVNNKCAKKPVEALKKKNQTINKQLTLEQFCIKKKTPSCLRVENHDDLLRDLKDLINRPSQGEDFGYQSVLQCDKLFVQNCVINNDKLKYYPLHYELRKYQFQLAQTALYNNTLVCLPTGLGKTWIAAIVILNYYLWFPEGKIFFLAPTKPLVAQQLLCLDVFKDIIPQNKSIFLCGTTPDRKEFYQSKQVFFMTPQTMENDLKKNKFNHNSVSLIIFDEAHRATGNYSYTNIIRLLNVCKFGYRILGLSATPGNSLEQVQEVITNLCISKIQVIIVNMKYKDETDLDVKMYIKNRNVAIEIIKSKQLLLKYKDSQQIEDLCLLIIPILKQVSDKIVRFKIIPIAMIKFLINPLTLNVGILFRLREELNQDQTNIELQIGRGFKIQTIQIENLFLLLFYVAVLSQLVYAKKVLLEQGIGSFIDYIMNFQTTKTTISQKKLLVEDVAFTKLMNYIQGMTIENTKKHPKLCKMNQLLTAFFKNPLTLSSKAIVFTNSRSTAREIIEFLRSCELVKASIFIGQQSKKGGIEGMSQKLQIEVMQMFKSNQLNVLVATCIAEEGLDIGEVDLIICYDSGFTPIRMIQRMGRTGRKRDGNIIILLSEGKEVRDYERFLKEGKKIKKQIRANSLNLQLNETAFQNKNKPKVKKEPVLLNFFSFNPKLIFQEQNLKFFRTDKECVEFRSLQYRINQDELLLPDKKTKKLLKIRKFHLTESVIMDNVSEDTIQIPTIKQTTQKLHNQDQQSFLNEETIQYSIQDHLKDQDYNGNYKFDQSVKELSIIKNLPGDNEDQILSYQQILKKKRQSIREELKESEIKDTGEFEEQGQLKGMGEFYEYQLEKRQEIEEIQEQKEQEESDTSQELRELEDLEQFKMEQAKELQEFKYYEIEEQENLEDIQMLKQLQQKLENLSESQDQGVLGPEFQKYQTLFNSQLQILDSSLDMDLIMQIVQDEEDIDIFFNTDVQDDLDYNLLQWCADDNNLCDVLKNPQKQVI